MRLHAWTLGLGAWLMTGCLSLHGEKQACRDDSDCLDGNVCEDNLCVAGEGGAQGPGDSAGDDLPDGTDPACTFELGCRCGGSSTGGSPATDCQPPGFQQDEGCAAGLSCVDGVCQACVGGTCSTDTASTVAGPGDGSCGTCVGDTCVLCHPDGVCGICQGDDCQPCADEQCLTTAPGGSNWCVGAIDCTEGDCVEHECLTPDMVGIPDDGLGGSNSCGGQPCPGGYDCVGGQCRWGIGLPEPDLERCGGIFFVNAAAPTEGSDGRSWSTAYPNLKVALNQAMSYGIACDEVTEIWVARGTYTPSSTGDRLASFGLTRNIALYGGFVGDETSRDQRDHVANLTVLSGDIHGDDDRGEVSNNSRIVLLAHGVTVDGIETSWNVPPANSNTVVDGFTIRAGYGDTREEDYYSTAGTAIGSYFPSSPTLRNLRVVDHLTEQGGAAIYIGGASTLENLFVAHNRFVRSDGYAVLELAAYNIEREEEQVLTDSVIVDNDGSVSMDGGDARIERTYIEGDLRPYEGTMVFVDSQITGGLEVGYTTRVEMTRSVLAHGEPTSEDIHLYDQAELTLDNSVVAGASLSLSGWTRMRWTHVTYTGGGSSPYAQDNAEIALVNSLVHSTQWNSGPETGLSSTASCVPRTDPIAECSEGPMFRGNYPGAWTTLSYDRATAQTTLTDSSRTFVPGALAGFFLQTLGESNRERWLLVQDNTEHSIVVYGNQTSRVTAGDEYVLHDLRLHADASAVDAADDDRALTTDMTGQGRVDIVNGGAAAGIADQGAFELTEQVIASCQVDCS